MTIPSREELNSGHRRAAENRISKLKDMDFYCMTVTKDLYAEVLFRGAHCQEITVTMKLESNLNFKTLKSKAIKFIRDEVEEDIRGYEMDETRNMTEQAEAVTQ